MRQKNRGAAVALLVIYTGGTIGMAQGPSGLAPKAGLLEAHLPKGAQVVAFDPLLDSADVGPQHWNRIIDLITDWQAADPSAAVLVIHGTDTMAFTGAALSQALSGALSPSAPVILCGSMQPLESGGDAEANLALAIRAAGEQAAGVWLAFAGRVMPAAGLVKHNSHGADAFRAQPQAPFAPPARRYDPAKRLAILTLTPALPVAALAAALRELDGAVLRVFGAGTMMGDAALAEALRTAIQNGCPIRAVSQCEAGGLTPAAYAAGEAIWAAGVQNGGAETPEIALARLWLTLST